MALLFALSGPSADALAQGEELVDLELVLLVDVSASVSDEEFRLQATGLATAFTSSDFLAAVDGLTERGLATCIVQWSDHGNQRVAIDWRPILGETDAFELATAVAAMPRLIDHGHTALGDALVFGLAQLESNRFSGLRRVIDLSGDGRANDGYPLRLARKEAIDRGVTINGLAILNELPLLDRYFRSYLIGGSDAFVMVARDYDDFAQAMTEKLVREIRSLPLSREDAPREDPRNGTKLAKQERQREHDDAQHRALRAAWSR